MSRRLRRLPILLLPLLLVAALTSCGSDSGGSPAGTVDGLDAVGIKGAAGSEPTVTWKSEMSADKLVSKTLTTGDGAEVKDGDKVLTNIWIGNGVDKRKTFSTWEQGQPEVVTVDQKNLSPIFADAMTGHTIGSRIAVTAPADKAFGPQGNPQLGIGNKDSVLVIIDLMGIQETLDGPKGAAKPSPAWAPKLVGKGDAITGLDFSKAPDPDGRLRSAALVEGNGAVVKKGQTITVDYLGQVFGGKSPFDESYSKQPASFGIGAGQVIPGWDKTLVGATIGSRIVMAIPPKQGYGSKGNPQAGIKGTDTLYFVVDILGAN